MLAAVIFDFDGLILETETPEVRSWEHVFSLYGATYPEWFWRYTLGRGAEQVRERPYELLVKQLPPQSLPPEPEVLRMREAKLVELLAELEVMPGVADLIRQARELRLGLGVASSSRHAWVDAHLGRLGLGEAFDHVVCADDVTRAKPFPDLYLECCSRLGVEAQRALALEDSANGCRAAREAGLYVIAVPTWMSDPAELAAHVVLDSLASLDLAEFVASPGRLRSSDGSGEPPAPEPPNSGHDHTVAT